MLWVFKDDVMLYKDKIYLSGIEFVSGGSLGEKYHFALGRMLENLGKKLYADGFIKVDSHGDSGDTEVTISLHTIKFEEGTTEKNIECYRKLKLKI